MSVELLFTESENPHPSRARRLIAAHPELRELMGRNRWSGVLALMLVAVQLGLAAWLSSHALGWSVLAAAVVGAHVVHALYAIVHETAHGSVAQSRAGNRMVTLLCNVPLVVPFAVALTHYHRVHHRQQGRDGRDPDLPAAWERRWFFGGPLRKLAYTFVFPVAQLLRPIHPRDRLSPTNGWLVANVALQLVVVAAIMGVWGWRPLVYLGLSVYLWSGPHPVLFARFIQEHFVTTEDGHETHSYYGVLNLVTLNIGYHVEHHDLPSVPWNRLPRVTRIAPELYDDRVQHRHWWRLGWQFLFDRRVQVASRVARVHRSGGPAVDRSQDGLGELPCAQPLEG